jgi:hypothetical protein
MKLEITLIPDVSNLTYQTMTTKELDDYADSLIKEIRGPVGYLGVYYTKDRLDDKKYRITNDAFVKFMTRDRWVEYIQASVKEMSFADESLTYNLWESEEFLDSIKVVTSEHKWGSRVELTIPDNFVEFSVSEAFEEFHQTIVNTIWKDTDVATYSKISVAELE